MISILPPRDFELAQPRLEQLAKLRVEHRHEERLARIRSHHAT